MSVANRTEPRNLDQTVPRNRNASLIGMSTYKGYLHTHKPGISNDEVVQGYTDWAQNYEEV